MSQAHVGSPLMLAYKGNGYVNHTFLYYHKANTTQGRLKHHVKAHHNPHLVLSKRQEAPVDESNSGYTAGWSWYDDNIPDEVDLGKDADGLEKGVANLFNNEEHANRQFAECLEINVGGDVGNVIMEGDFEMVAGSTFSGSDSYATDDANCANGSVDYDDGSVDLNTGRRKKRSVQVGPDRGKDDVCAVGCYLPNNGNVANGPACSASGAYCIGNINDYSDPADCVLLENSDPSCAGITCTWQNVCS
ncbi:hypothetical protein CBS101457_005094 [Exobasidium rhododendri]|nr:hypothetical protein CBS101457_005094 [Exobasidium rhododendri]